MLKDKRVLVKGAGDFASASIRRLHLAGAKVVCTELAKPLTIRRRVAFSEAIYTGEHTVEDVTGVRATPEKVGQILSENKVPIVVDPETRILDAQQFEIVIDARMAKRNLGTNIDDAPIVIALGPGFEAGRDCHAVVETLAGRDLGRVIYKGKPAQDTGVPVPLEFGDSYAPPPAQGSAEPCSTGFIPCCAGFDMNSLILRAPGDGVFNGEKGIGDPVKNGDLIGKIGDIDLVATADGVIRGLIHDSVDVTKDLKIGDIDPSGDIGRVNRISEKANAIAGGVLEAVLYLLNK